MARTCSPSRPFCKAFHLSSISGTAGALLVLLGSGVACPVAAQYCYSTTATITSSPNPSNVGQTVTFTATVRPAQLGGFPAGTLNFRELGSGSPLNATPIALDATGHASFSTASLGAGTHNVYAQYLGTSDWCAVSSSPVAQVVSGPAQCSSTTTTMTSSPNPALFSEAVTFAARVTATSGNPSGSVNFVDDAAGLTLNLAPLPLDGTGNVTFSTAVLNTGTHNVYAQFLGSLTWCASISNVVMQKVLVSGVDLAVQICGTTHFSGPRGSRTPASYTATVTNLGSEPATGVALFFPLTLSTPTASQGECPILVGGGSLHSACDVGALAPGASATVTFDESVLDGEKIEVSVTGDQPDVAPGNNRTSLRADAIDCGFIEDAAGCPLLANVVPVACQKPLPASACNGVGPLAALSQPPGLSLAGHRFPLAAVPTDLQPYYALRDQVFGTTPSGRRYTQLYYGYGAEVSGHLVTNPSLANQGLSTIQAWQGNVRALANGQGDSATITSDQINGLNTFIESLKSAASPELRAVLSREQAALDLPSLVGKTMSQAWTRQQQTAPATVTLPASASIHGLNGSYFHSDVRVLNPSATSSVTATLRYRCFVGSCPNNVQTLTLAPREMRSLDDIDGTLFNAPESAGPIEITGDVIVDSRVYTPGKPAPTIGAFVPGLTADEAVAEAVLLSLSHSVDRGKGFRTNAGVYNPGGDPLLVTFSLFDPTGKPIGQTSRNIGPLSAVQVNDFFGSSGITQDVDNAYCVVKSDDIHELFVYATVIDNQSEDQVFIKGKNARGVPSGTTTLPAAASIHGLNGAFFHSDVRVFNPSTTASTVTATYRCFTGSCPSNVQTFSLAPREMKIFDDIVGTLFNAPESAGPIEFTGSALVDSRVYSPTKPAPTTGDDVPGLSEDESYQQAVLTSLSRSADPSVGFRTNVGVYNLGALPLTVTFSIYAPSGNLLGQTTRQLAGQSATQITDIFGATGITGDVPNAYCIVSGVGIGTPFGLGKLFTYATVIDNRSQDSTFVTGRPLGTGLVTAAGVASRYAPVAWASRGATSLAALLLLALGAALSRKR